MGAWLVLLAVLTALSLRGFGQFQLGTYDDDGMYAMLARSLVFSGTYDVRTGPASPPRPNAYPFVFPLVLTPAIAWAPDTYEQLTLPSLLATLINISLLFWGWPLLARNRSRGWALVVAALYALNPLTIGHTNMVMSEAVFTTFTLSALLTAEAAARQPALWRFVLLGFLAASALFTRTVGLVLVVAVAWRVLGGVPMGALRRAVPMIAGGLLLIVPVLVLTPVGARDLIPVRYVARRIEDVQAARRNGEMEAAVKRAGGRLREYATGLLREAVVPIGGGLREADMADRLGLPILPWLLGGLTTALIVIGAVATRVEQRLTPAVLLFELLYLATIVAWPYATVRFLSPILPFLIFQLLTGVQRVAQAALPAGARRGRLPLAAAACLAAALAIGSLWKNLSPAAPSVRFARDFRREGEWLRRHTTPDAVVMTEYPLAIRLHSDRTTVAAPQVTSAGALLAQLDAYAVRFVEVGPKLEWRVDGQREYGAYTRDTLLPLLEQLQEEGRLRLVYASDPHDLVRIYQVESPRS